MDYNPYNTSCNKWSKLVSSPSWLPTVLYIGLSFTCIHTPTGGCCHAITFGRIRRSVSGPRSLCQVDVSLDSNCLPSDFILLWDLLFLFLHCFKAKPFSNLFFFYMKWKKSFIFPNQGAPPFLKSRATLLVIRRSRSGHTFLDNDFLGEL